jgi:hypothetical protein
MEKKELDLWKIAEVISDEEMEDIKGGCGCGCLWSTCGGSSSSANSSANAAQGYMSHCD